MQFKTTSSAFFTFIGAGAAIALISGFAQLADEMMEGETLQFDNAVLMALREPGKPTEALGPSWLAEAARDITALGSFSVLAIVLTVVSLSFIMSEQRRTGVFLAFSVISGAVLSTLLKTIFARPRPEFTALTRIYTASFPSGHAMLSAVVYLTFGALLAETTTNPRLRILYLSAAIFLTFIVGVSRVYLGVHYPTDVVAGWCLGTAWALICVGALRYMKQGSARRPRRSKEQL